MITLSGLQKGTPHHINRNSRFQFLPPLLLSAHLLLSLLLQLLLGCVLPLLLPLFPLTSPIFLSTPLFLGRVCFESLRTTLSHTNMEGRINVTENKNKATFKEGQYHTQLMPTMTIHWTESHLHSTTTGVWSQTSTKLAIAARADAFPAPSPLPFVVPESTSASCLRRKRQRNLVVCTAVVARGANRRNRSQT